MEVAPKRITSMMMCDVACLVVCTKYPKKTPVLIAETTGSRRKISVRIITFPLKKRVTVLVQAPKPLVKLENEPLSSDLLDLARLSYCRFHCHNIPQFNLNKNNIFYFVESILSIVYIILFDLRLLRKLWFR